MYTFTHKIKSKTYFKVEHIDDAEANIALSTGTNTAHFVNFINELLDILDMDEGLRVSYLVMDNCKIYKPYPMIRKMESRGYRVMYLPPYSSALDAIENL